MDSRIKDFLNQIQVADLQAIKDALWFVADHTSFTDAKKITLANLLYTAIVDANTNNFQALTPKAFYDSVMTIERKGIARLATDEEIDSRAGEGLIPSSKQALMQARWYREWFPAGSFPQVIFSNNAATASDKKATSYQAGFHHPAADGAWSGSAQFFPIELYLINAQFKMVYCTIACTTSAGNHGGTHILVSSGSTTLLPLGTTGVSLYMSADGNSFGCTPNGTVTDVRIAITVNAIFK